MVTLFRDIYSQPYYIKRIKELRRINPNLDGLRPVRNIKKALFVSVCLSFSTAILQLTVGLIANAWSVLICLSSAVLALISFVAVVYIVGIMIRDWIDSVSEQMANSQ